LSEIQNKLNNIMDQVQAIMESHPRAHIPPSEELTELLRRANIYFAHMDDENRDYFQYVNHAIEDKTEWKI
jgi:L-rhamnose mutarotase